MPPLPSVPQQAKDILAKYTAKPTTSKYVTGGSSAALLAALSAPKSTDKITSQKKRLETSAYAIINSNAPIGDKISALKKLDTGEKKGGESVLTRALNILNKPLAITTAGVARIADPKRNFLADVRNNVTPTEIFATQKWFQDLPTVGKIAVGIGSSIALDPLTYIAPSAKLAALGDAAGLSKSLRSAAKAAEVAGNFDDAAKARTIAGNLLRKGQGGIGALDNATIKWAGNFIGVDDLKAGIYFNVPGTGRIASRIAKTVTGEGIKPLQIYLGRPMVARKISSFAYNTLGRVKTSSIIKNIGDNVAFQGGEGAVKRAVLEAATPEEALVLDTVIDSTRLGKGSTSRFTSIRQAKEDYVVKRILDAGIDPADVAKAEGGNTAALARVNAADPEIMGLVDELGASVLTDSLAVGGDSLENVGLARDSMGQMFDPRDLHQNPVLTDAAREAGIGDRTKTLTVSTPIGPKKIGPEMHARVDYGHMYLGETLLHPSQETVRFVAYVPDKNGREIPTVISSGVAFEGKTAEEVARQRGNIGYIESGGPKGRKGERVRFRVTDKKGNIKYMDLPADRIEKQVLPPHPEGLSVREQANIVNNKVFGYDLFEMDYIKGLELAKSRYANLHLREVAAAYLLGNSIGVGDLDVILKDFPKSTVKAFKRIEKAADNLAIAIDNVYGASNDVANISNAVENQLKEINSVLTERIQTLEALRAKAQKSTPKMIELDGAIATEKAKQAKLGKRLEKLEDDIVSGNKAVDEIKAEIDDILAGFDPTVAAAMDPEGAARRIAASTKTSENVAPVVAPDTVSVADFSKTGDTEGALLASQVNDLQYELDDLLNSQRAGINVPQKEIDTVQRKFDAARKRLDNYIAKTQPAAAPAVVAEPVAIPEVAAEVPSVRVTELEARRAEIDAELADLRSQVDSAPTAPVVSGDVAEQFNAFVDSAGFTGQIKTVAKRYAENIEAAKAVEAGNPIPFEFPTPKKPGALRDAVEKEILSNRTGSRIQGTAEANGSRWTTNAYFAISEKAFPEGVTFQKLTPLENPPNIQGLIDRIDVENLKPVVSAELVGVAPDTRTSAKQGSLPVVQPVVKITTEDGTELLFNQAILKPFGSDLQILVDGQSQMAVFFKDGEIVGLAMAVRGLSEKNVAQLVEDFSKVGRLDNAKRQQLETILEGAPTPAVADETAEQTTALTNRINELTAESNAINKELSDIAATPPVETAAKRIAGEAKTTPVEPRGFDAIDDPARRAVAEEAAKAYGVGPERVDEFVDRFNRVDAARENYTSLLSRQAEGASTAEEVAQAEEVLTKASADLFDIKNEALASRISADAAVRRAKLTFAATNLDEVDSWKAEPPAGGYSPEWEEATVQNVVANSESAVAAGKDNTKRLAELRRELRNTSKNPKAKNARPVSEIENDIRAYEIVSEFIDGVDTTGVRAAEAASREMSAYDDLRLAVNEHDVRNASAPANARPDPNLDPDVLAAKSVYEAAQSETVSLANAAADNAKAASFMSSTKGLTTNQVERIIDSITSGSLDDTIKQVVSELGLPAPSKRAVAKAAAEVGDDVDAMRVITKNANDAELVDRTTKAAKGKKKAVEELGENPEDLPLTSAKSKKSVEKARAKIAELRSALNDVLQKKGKLTASQQSLANDLDAAQGRIDVYTKELNRIEKNRAARYGPQEASIRSQLDDAERELWDIAENAATSLRIALHAEERALATAARRWDRLKWEKWRYSPQGQEAMRTVVRKGFTSISRQAQAPNDIADALMLLTRITTPGELPAFFKYFDKLTNIFKSWAVATPGFIARNGYSGGFMMYLDNIPVGSVTNFLKADFTYTREFAAATAEGLDTASATARALEAVSKAHGEKIGKNYSNVVRSGVLEQGGQADSLVGQVMDSRDPKTVLDRIAANPVTNSTYRLNSRMERALRGGHMMGVLDNGGTLETAIDKMFKFHFDYSDINKFEARWMRRVAPFYVWLRKNLPLQMEMIFRNPKAYNRYTIFKDSIEAASDGEDIVPSWISDRMHIRLPWTLPGGQMYVLPDLPIKDLNILTNWNELVGSVNPVIKTPIEMVMDTKLYFGKSQQFQGYVQMPDVYQAAGLGAAMEALGFAKRDKDGKLLVQDKQMYALEQFFPFFGRARRLLPSEEKYQDRLPVQVVNTLFGLSLRANTKSDKAGELYKRQAELDKLAEALNDLGYGGYQYWKKQVQLASKPTDADKRPYLALLQPKGGLPLNSPYTNVSGSGTDWRAAGQGLAALIGQQQGSTGR